MKFESIRSLISEKDSKESSLFKFFKYRSCRETKDLICSNSDKSTFIVAFVLKFKNSDSEMFIISMSVSILYILFKLLPKTLELIIISSDTIST